MACLLGGLIHIEQEWLFLAVRLLSRCNTLAGPCAPPFFVTEQPRSGCDHLFRFSTSRANKMTNALTRSLISKTLENAVAKRDEEAVLSVIRNINPTITPTSIPGVFRMGMPRLCEFVFGDATTGAVAQIIPPHTFALFIEAPKPMFWRHRDAGLLALAWRRGLSPKGICLRAQAPGFGAEQQDFLAYTDNISAHQRLRFLQTCGHPYDCTLAGEEWDEILGQI